jgi:hypothetical protein
MRIESELCDDGSHRVYEKLVWAIAPVVVCPKHKQQLQTRCPHCLEQQRVLTANSVPGYCNKCVTRLGAPHLSHSEPGSEEDLWIAETIGEMVAAAPHVDLECLIARYRGAIIRHASRVAGGSIRALSRLSGVRYSQIMNCLRDDKTVGIDLFLKGLHGLNLSVRDLFQELSGSIEWEQPYPRASHVAPRYSADFRRQCLQQELDSPHPRSPRELASSLGYSGTAQLWRADQDRFLELAQRASPDARLSSAAKPLAALKDRARQALEASLAESLSRSAKQVAKELKIKEGTLRGWFPELCKSIASKRDEDTDQACRTELERALTEIPVPSLTEVARRAGQTLAILKTRAPDLCRALQNAKASHARNQTESLTQRVIPFLSKDPPPTGAEAARKLGTSWAAIKRQLPDLARQLVKRAKSYRQAESMLCEMTVFDEVEKAVNKLHSVEEYPSATRVAYETANLPQSWSLLNDARKRAIAKLRDSSTDSPADDTALSATFAKAQAKTC